MSTFKASIAIMLFGLMSCNDKNLNTEITGIKVIDQIPSASGLEMIEDQIFIIGDNSPWLFKLNPSFEILDKIELHQEFAQKFDVIPKPVKPDFEALTSYVEKGKTRLMIFGSGSLRETRDQLIIVDPQTRETHQYSLTALYLHLIKTANLQAEDLNLEAAVTSNTHLYLFNRGKNISFKCLIQDLLDYLKTGTRIPDFEITAYELPKLNGIAAGFSGACINKEQTKIFFTATVENTENWIADGEVTGSFIGYIDLKNTSISTTQLIIDNQPLLTKVESVAIQNESGNNYKLLLVTDNDGKASQLITADLRL
jgi:hypothetical protein